MSALPFSITPIQSIRCNVCVSVWPLEALKKRSLNWHSLGKARLRQGRAGDRWQMNLVCINFNLFYYCRWPHMSSVCRIFPKLANRTWRVCYRCSGATICACEHNRPYKQYRYHHSFLSPEYQKMDKLIQFIINKTGNILDTLILLLMIATHESLYSYHSYEAVSEWVSERVLREDKSHSTGLTMSEP